MVRNRLKRYGAAFGKAFLATVGLVVAFDIVAPGSGPIEVLPILIVLVVLSGVFAHRANPQEA